MTQRLRVWVEESGADWMAIAEIDEVRIYEEPHLDQWAARADADEFKAKLLVDLAPEATERAARVADDVATGPSRTPIERAVGAVIAKRIREGRP